MICCCCCCCCCGGGGGGGGGGGVGEVDDVVKVEDECRRPRKKNFSRFPVNLDDRSEPTTNLLVLSLLYTEKHIPPSLAILGILNYSPALLLQLVPLASRLLSSSCQPSATANHSLTTIE